MTYIQPWVLAVFACLVGRGRGRIKPRPLRRRSRGEWLWSGRAGSCGCLDLTQEGTQVANLRIRHGWSNGKGRDSQPASGDGKGRGDEIGQGTHQHTTHRHEVMGHAIETHNPSAHV